VYRLKPSELTRSLFLTSGGTSNVLQRLTTSNLRPQVFTVGRRFGLAAKHG
jgi:hypothetical protein